MMIDANLRHVVLGGTFDPIHYGHLSTAEALAAELTLPQVVLLPNGVPPHRSQPIATPQQRLTMLQLAIENHPLLSVDPRELQRPGTSFTLQTLQEIRQEIGQQALLGFIIGADALLTIQQWYRWQELLTYCHLLVCRRFDTVAFHHDNRLSDWIVANSAQNIEQLMSQSCGYIYFTNTPLIEISSTIIRQSIQNSYVNVTTLPKKVLMYIKQQKLYHVLA